MNKTINESCSAFQPVAQEELWLVSGGYSSCRASVSFGPAVDPTKPTCPGPNPQPYFPRQM